MSFSTTIFLTESGLFDFDLTFVLEGSLFLLLALLVTFVFISPISTQIDERTEFIDYTLRKSTIFLTLGYEKLANCMELLTDEINEMNRQLKLVRTSINTQFEEEISTVQQENTKLLRKLRGNLAIKSASLFAEISPQLISLTDTFFQKKFKTS